MATHDAAASLVGRLRPPGVREFGPIIALAGAYAAAGIFATAIQSIGQSASIYWPAAGVAVGGLLVLPQRRWRLLLAVLLLLQLGHAVLVGPTLITLVLWPTANLLGPVTIAMLAIRWRAHRLKSVGDVMAFVTATFVGTVAAALIGGLAATAALTDGSFAAAAGAWLVGDVLGVLTVTPCVLLLGGVVPWRDDRAAEVWGSVTLAGIVTVVLFVLPPSPISVHLSWLVVLPLIWSAIRTRLAGTTLGVTLTTFVAVGATALGRGPFADPTLPGGANAVLLHLFLAATVVTTLVLASRSEESETYQGLAQAREQLLAAVSHELRTPLTPIVGFSELLLEPGRAQTLDTTTRDGLEVILRNGRHLTSMINDLLMLSRVRHDGSDRALLAQPRPTDVGELVQRVLRERPDRTDVAYEGDAKPAVALADPAHVERILVNLLDNAAKYGRPPVTVRVRTRDRRVELRVVDHGPGVPDWFLPHLFDAFSQEVTGDQRPTIGLGLGLAISRDLALANGGTLRYEHADRGGAEFVLRLPAVAHASAAP